MSTILQTPPSSAPNPEHAALERSSSPRRPRWRRRLIDVERGISRGFRIESSMFAYVFGLSITISAAVILGISLIQWTIVILASASVFAAELFNLALRSMNRAEETDQKYIEAVNISRAAVFVVIVGAVISTCLIFGQRVNELWHK